MSDLFIWEEGWYANLVVGEDHLQVAELQRRLFLPGITDIAMETLLNVFLLLRGEPLGILGKIGDEKVSENGDHASSSALCNSFISPVHGETVRRSKQTEDENPSPRKLPLDAIHLSDGARQQSSEGAS